MRISLRRFRKADRMKAASSWAADACSVRTARRLPMLLRTGAGERSARRRMAPGIFRVMPANAREAASGARRIMAPAHSDQCEGHVTHDSGGMQDGNNMKPKEAQFAQNLLHGSAAADRMCLSR